jgi:uncharacterized protein YndB with AHSA1/START domain
MPSAIHEQAVLDAPVATVWELVSNPERYPEWFPRVLEIQGERFEEGEDFIQVTRLPLGKRDEIHFLIDHLDEFHEIRMHCMISGMFVHWQLTDARGGTFLDAEFGIDPIRRRDRVSELTWGRRFLRRWLVEAVAGLKRATAAQPSH